MNTVAFYTLGCKVNQYDSQAMLELFEQAGYSPRAFSESADVYVINTCVVTGTGEQKSRQAVRRALRRNPAAQVVLSGCLAQKEAEGLFGLGVRLVLGNHRRAEVVTLLEEAVATDTRIAAVDQVQHVPFERLSISRNEGHTRAVMKIQEGCDRWCAYCIIPSVRGGIRSRPVEEIAQEAQRLSDAGYQEVVLTGIHLSSFGRDLQDAALLDAVHAAAAPQGIRRVRLGSLEPVIATEVFAQGLAAIGKVCPQFHLSLQSGSDTVLKRMRRRYTGTEYLDAARHLRAAFPGCALTTDVIAGFPGESDEEHRDTIAFLQEAGFAKLHVFPFSAREGTAAAAMPDQLPKAVKDQRARELIRLGEEMNLAYRTSLLHTVQDVLLEEQDGGLWKGHSAQYLPVWCDRGSQGEVVTLLITAIKDDGFLGTLAPATGKQA